MRRDKIGAIFGNLAHFVVILRGKFKQRLDVVLRGSTGDRDIVEPGTEGRIEEFDPLVSNVKNWNNL